MAPTCSGRWPASHALVVGLLGFRAFFHELGLDLFGMRDRVVGLAGGLVLDFALGLQLPLRPVRVLVGFGHI